MPISDIEECSSRDCASCGLEVRHRPDAITVKLCEEDVASLRIDLKSDLDGLGGSVRRAMAVQCILEEDFEDALFFAKDAVRNEPGNQEAMMLLANICHLAGQYQTACEQCILILDLAKAPDSGAKGLPTSCFLGLLRSGSQLENPCVVLGSTVLAEMNAFCEAFAVHDAVRSTREDRAAALVAMADICMTTRSVEHLARAKEYYTLAADLGQAHKAALLAAECGLAAVKMRGQIVQFTPGPPELSHGKRRVCGHCKCDGAQIECPSCKSVAYCTKQCLRKGRKQHRKSCVNMANANNRKNDLCHANSACALSGMGLAQLFQRTSRCKEEWYHADMVASCAKLCSRNTGATKLIQALFLLYHQVDLLKDSSQPVSLELSLNLNTGTDTTHCAPSRADPELSTSFSGTRVSVAANSRGLPDHIRYEDIVEHEHSTEKSDEEDTNQARLHQRVVNDAQMCQTVSTSNAMSARVAALEAELGSLAEKHAATLKGLDSEAQHHETCIADMKAELERSRAQTRAVSAELQTCLGQSETKSQTQGKMLEHLQTELQHLTGHGLDLLSTSHLEEIHERVKSSVDSLEKCIHSRHQEANDQRLCIVCHDNDRCVLLLPCRHLSLCQSCLLLVTHCPMCRSEIADNVLVFL